MKTTLMSFALASLFLIPPAFAVEGRPIECIYSGIAGKKKKTYSAQMVAVCQEFDTSYPNNFSNVCVYKDSKWQYGNLIYDKKLGHVFKYRFVCDLGVNAVRDEDSVDLKAPSIVNAVQDKTKPANEQRVVMQGNKYKSQVIANPLGSTEMPSLCYLTAQVGKPRSPKPCGSDPNAADYCEFVDLKHATYLGNWWVIYTRPNKQSPSFCLGGVRSIDAQKAKNDYGEDIKVVRNVKLTKDAFVAKINALKPAIGTDPTLDFKLVACINNNGKKITRYSCANTDSPIESWESDEDAFRVKLTETLMASPVKYTIGTKVSTGTRQVALTNLNINIIKKATTAEQKALMQAQVETLTTELSEAIEAKIAEANGVYPTLKTSHLNNGCYVSWLQSEPARIFNPEPPGRVFLFNKNSKGVVTKIYCTDVETTEITND